MPPKGNKSVGASNAYNGLKQYKNSKAFRNAYKRSPKSACGKTKSLCASGDSDPNA